MYDDDEYEDLPGVKRGSGLGVGARGASSVLDASDAIFFPSSSTPGKGGMSRLSLLLNPWETWNGET